MAHILAKLRGIEIEHIEAILKKDASQHAEHGLFLEHLWKNDDDKNEVLFLFHSTDLERSRAFINSMHALARKENPAAKLPAMIFLK